MPSQFFNDSIFWVEIEKVFPNPFQPRKEFEEAKLRDLAGSIRQYGILQPLVVTRKEVTKPDGGLATEYELISGERRLRASKIAGLSQVPVLIRDKEESDQLKLELAIIENLQREDLNVVDRAKAFQRLADEFNFKHVEIAKKVGKSREYVSNSLRILLLPEEILQALTDGKISEGHSRPLLMLADRKEEQMVLFKEMMIRKMTVREAELTARKIAVERIRKPERMPDPELMELEEKLAHTLGARVHIERKDKGGKIMIDFFSNDDLRAILEAVNNKTAMPIAAAAETQTETLIDDRSDEEKEAQENDEELYSVDNFVV
ncbi:MAG: ParB/RepB/Spo0J family partition protein [Candidatus Paceibacterota bacterium]